MSSEAALDTAGTRFRFKVAVAATLLLLGVILTACGGGGERARILCGAD